MGARVVNTFMPLRQDDKDYSAPVTAYVRACRKALEGPPPTTEGEGVEKYGGSGPAEGKLNEAIRGFFQRYPCDPRAVEFFHTLEPRVVDRVLREFVPKREGDSDYSAIVMCFAKRCLGDSDAVEPAWKRARN